MKRHAIRFAVFGVLVALAAAVFCLGPAVSRPALALNTGLDATAQTAGLPTGGAGDSDLVSIVGKVINVLLGLIGVLFTVLVIYGGVLWMTAAGNPKQVDTAKSIMMQATIGLVIIFASYAVVSFVIDNIIPATGTKEALLFSGKNAIV